MNRQPPAYLFAPDDATALADKLTAEDAMGWTYTTEPCGVKSKIKVADDEGFVVGYLY